MTDERLQQENEQLRNELEAYRQREADDLRRRLALAEQAAEHYKAEAHRNAEIGRQIAAESEKKLAKLRAEIATMRERETHARRFRKSD